MTVLAGILVACAVWLACARAPHVRLRAVVPPAGQNRTRSLPVSLLAALALGVGIALVLSSKWGIGLGAGASVLAHRFTKSLEPRAQRERRRELARQLPVVCDLLAATLASGASVAAAVAAVAAAAGPPASEGLLRVLGALRLGASPAEAWQEARLDESFARVANAFQRSAVSGAPIADVLHGVAEDERRRRRSAVEIAARAAGVRTVAPLAACFLPAFILLGIVPVIASMATSVFEN